MLTYHLVPADEYHATMPTYTPAAFAVEGFIHTTKTLSNVHVVANRYYQADSRPYLLLTIDLERIAAPWRYDAAGEEYPHLYGPLEQMAVVKVQQCPRAADGTFLPIPIAD